MKNNDNNLKLNEILNNLFDKAWGVSLSETEKTSMSRNLEQITKVEEVKPIVMESPFVMTFKIFRQKAFLPVFLILIVMFSGTASLLAKNSLPGDVLYPLKINVNEKLQSLLSVGAKSSAEIETLHARARIMEIEKLTAENKLSLPVLTAAQKSFDDNAIKIKQYTEELKLSGDIDTANEITSDFESSLRNHHSLLVALREKGENKDSSLNSFVEAIDIHLKSASLSRKNTEEIIATSTSKTNVEISALGALKSAKNKIDETEKYINKADGNLDQSLKTLVDTQLDSAKGLFTDGQAKLNTKAFGEAFITFKKARRKAEEAKLTLDSKDEIKTVLPGFIKQREIEEDDATTSQSVRNIGNSLMDDHKNKGENRHD